MAMKTAGSMQPRVELRNHQPAVAHDTLTIEHTHDLPEADRRSLTHLKGRTGPPDHGA